MSLSGHRNPDGTYNGVAALSELYGIPVGEIRAIADKVKANHARMNGCPYHEFEPIPGTANAAGLRQRYACRHCGGEVDAVAYRWHQDGRRPKP